MGNEDIKHYQCYEFAKTIYGIRQIEFLTKIVATDETRLFLSNIYVAGDTIVASDGLAMGVLKNIFEIADGYYYKVKGVKNRIILAKNEKDLNFPNWKKVILEYDKIKPIPLDLRHNYLYGKEEIVYRIARERELPILNSGYLKLIPPDEYKVYYQHGKRQVIFVSKYIDFKILIMSMEKEK